MSLHNDSHRNHHDTGICVSSSIPFVFETCHDHSSQLCVCLFLIRAADIRDIIDQLFDATAADGWSGQAIYESLSLLFSGGAGPASEGCIGWGIVDGEAFLERLAVRLQQDLSHHKVTA